jgi:diguanylate cyclase (GGDEF)-like protein
VPAAPARAFGRLLSWDPPARLPVPAGGLAVAGVVVAGLLNLIAGDPVGSGLPGIALAGIPLFVAAALLPAGRALAIGLATCAVTLLPLAARPAWGSAEAVGVAELAILVGASLALRAAVARLVVTRPEEPKPDARLSARIDSVLGIAEQLTKTVDRAEVLGIVVTETQRILGVDGTTIRIRRGDMLEVAAWAGIDDAVARQLPSVRIDEGWLADLFRTGRPWVSDDVRNDPFHPQLHGQVAAVRPIASELVMPLIHHGRVIGAISAATEAPRHWSGSDVEFVAALATHAAVAIHNAELFDKARTSAGRMAVLQAASARMTRQSSVESVGRAIVEETRQIIDYHNARVYVVEAPDDVVPIAFEGRVGAYEKVDLEVLRTKLGHGFTGWVALHGQPLLIADANADSRGLTIPGTDDIDESMLVVPMKYDEQVIGAITLSKLGLNKFDDEDLRLLTILADQAATALESARLLARTEALAGELRRLLDMGSELANSLEPRTVADLIARYMAESMGVDQCAISYWDRSSQRVLTWGYHPRERPAQVASEYALAGYPETMRVLNDQATVIVNIDDPAADPAEIALMRREGSHTLVMMPLVAKGQSIGLVEIISTTPVRLDESRLEFARTMANEAAMALENAKLYEEARNLADRDQLTGFYNHRFLHERLGEEIVRAQRSRAPLGLLMIDLDDFKLVNDTFGHLFGDRVLVWAAELIRSTLRASDVPARYGGDEFAVILPDSDADAARAVAGRILAAFQQRSFETEGRGAVPMAASIGVATFPLDGRSGQGLIAAADRALYRVKDAGGHGAGLATEGVLEHDGALRAGRPHELRPVANAAPAAATPAAGAAGAPTAASRRGRRGRTAQ